MSSTIKGGTHRIGGSLPPVEDSRPASLLGEHCPDDPVLRHQLARACRQAITSSDSEDGSRETPGEPTAGEFDVPPENRIRQPRVGSAAILAAVARSARLIAICGLVGGLIGVAVAVSTPRTYLAAAELLVEPHEPRVVHGDFEPDTPVTGASLAAIENQITMLTSRPVLEATVERLGLANDPEFNGQHASGLPIFAFVDGLRDLVSSSDGDTALTDRRHELAISSLARSLNVARGGRGFVVVVAATTNSPDKSALLVNTLNEVFLETQVRAGAVGRTVSELRVEAERAERAVAAFKAEMAAVGGEGRPITDQEIARLNEELSRARARTVELNAQAASARELDLDAIVTGSLPNEAAFASVTELRARFNDLKQAVDRLSVSLGPRHPERLAAEAQLEGAARQMELELRRGQASLQADLRRAVEREQELAGELARLRTRQGEWGGELATLHELESEAFLRRAALEDALARPLSETADISIISHAVPPLEPSSLPRAIVSAGGLAIGLLAGLGFAGARSARQGIADPPKPTGGQGHAKHIRRRRPASAASPAPSRHDDPGREWPAAATNINRVQQEAPEMYRDPRNGMPVRQPAMTDPRHAPAGYAPAPNYPDAGPYQAPHAFARHAPHMPQAPAGPPYPGYYAPPPPHTHGPAAPRWQPEDARYGAHPDAYPPAGHYQHGSHMPVQPAWGTPPAQDYGQAAYASPHEQEATHSPYGEESYHDEGEPMPRQAGYRYDGDAELADQLEEIRECLRDCREAIEYLVERGEPRRRYGT